MVDLYELNILEEKSYQTDMIRIQKSPTIYVCFALPTLSGGPQIHSWELGGPREQGEWSLGTFRRTEKNHQINTHFMSRSIYMYRCIGSKPSINAT